MNAPVITFFNNKGGVGKTSTLFNLSRMVARRGKRVLAVDLDPQANLTSLCLEDDQLAQIWADDEDGQAVPHTIFHAVQPVLSALGDVIPITPWVVSDPPTYLLIPGDLRLSEFEDKLAVEWNNALAGRPSGINITSAFARLIRTVAEQQAIDVVFIDVGPNLGAINRAALIASDAVVIPLVPDLFSLQGLRNVGRFLQTWRRDWQQGLDFYSERENKPSDRYPSGAMQPLGYLILQHRERQSRFVAAHERWADRIPETYLRAVLNVPDAPTRPDPNMLGAIRNYQSIAALAQEARKPIFDLTQADGAIGSHLQVVRESYRTYSDLADVIAARSGFTLD